MISLTKALDTLTQLETENESLKKQIEEKDQCVKTLESRLEACEKTIDQKNQAIADLQRNGTMAAEIFDMIGTTLQKAEEDMSATHPMNYDDAINCAIGKREKRIKELEAEVASLHLLLKQCLDAVSDEIDALDRAACNDGMVGEEYLLFNRIKKALFSPTGSSILKKLEAGEKMKSLLEELQSLFASDDDAFDGAEDKIPEVLAAWNEAEKGSEK